ncbi:hypothetical protein WN943_013500 [Citrus x changshan-huyou]
MPNSSSLQDGGKLFDRSSEAEASDIMMKYFAFLVVSELINEKHEWNEELIQQHFLRVDAEQITKIPLPRQPKPNQVVWHYDKKGEYSVKSGYQLALKMKTPDMASCLEEKQNSWNSIWYL